MRVVWFLVLIFALANARTIKSSQQDTEYVRYDNYSVHKLAVKNKAVLSVINILVENAEGYNLWKDYDEVSKEVHIMVSPKMLKSFQTLLKIFNVQSEVMLENVQELIDVEQEQAMTDSLEFDWTRYYELDEIEAWLSGLLETYSNVTESFHVATSYEGREIRGIKISHGTGKPGIFIESNIHAREWITSATVTWFINQLLTSQEERVRNLANNYDWYIVPVFNVDGFEYTHRLNRMWRKTRQPHPTSTCVGVDGNRNFGSHWMENGGASSNPCSETFAGEEAWSEPETKGLSEYLTSIRDKFQVYISVHSYSQLMLSPYGHTGEEFPENYDDLLAIGGAFADAIRALPYGSEYTYGSTASVLYVASGSSVDWVFNELDAKVGYTIECRDLGRYGFLLPAAYILPQCEEFMAGMVALVDKTQELGYFNV